MQPVTSVSKGVAMQVATVKKKERGIKVRPSTMEPIALLPTPMIRFQPESWPVKRVKLWSQPESRIPLRFLLQKMLYPTTACVIMSWGVQLKILACKTPNTEAIDKLSTYYVVRTILMKFGLISVKIKNFQQTRRRFYAPYLVWEDQVSLCLAIGGLETNQAREKVFHCGCLINFPTQV